MMACLSHSTVFNLRSFDDTISLKMPW